MKCCSLTEVHVRSEFRSHYRQSSLGKTQSHILRLLERPKISLFDGLLAYWVKVRVRLSVGLAVAVRHGRYPLLQVILKIIFLAIVVLDGSG